jgi:signal peptide peptidase SppA
MSGLAYTLQRAFKRKGLAAVALAINSPGGSAVQSALIARRIRALADEHDVPVFAFAEDVAASGGYWLATAADEIYADQGSIIGSIGVVSSAFGFPEVLKRAGVERRLHAAGEFKGSLDPFSEQRREDVAHLKAFLDEIHEYFRKQVRERRQGKLKADEATLFSGRWWSGGKALELGLIDGLGDVRTILRKRYGNNVKLKVVGESKAWWLRWMGLHPPSRGPAEPADLAESVIAAVEERLAWSRFGL